MEMDRNSQNIRTLFKLGSGESGKSTLVKQMKIIYQGGFSNEQLLSYRPIIYKSVLDCAQGVILAMRKFGFDDVLPENKVCNGSAHYPLAYAYHGCLQSNAERIMSYRVEQSPSFSFSQEIAEAIHHLSQDPVAAKVVDRTNEFYLMDSAA
jgi:guanine nucleotide-binding protein G(i) subunit alpha